MIQVRKVPLKAAARCAAHPTDASQGRTMRAGSAEGREASHTTLSPAGSFRSPLSSVHLSRVSLAAYGAPHECEGDGPH